MGGKCSKNDDSVLETTDLDGLESGGSSKKSWMFGKISWRKSKRSTIDEASLDFTHHKTTKSLISLLPPPVPEEAEAATEKKNEEEVVKQQNITDPDPQMAPSGKGQDSDRDKNCIDLQAESQSSPITTSIQDNDKDASDIGDKESRKDTETSETKETKEDSSTLKADADAEDTPKELEEDIVTDDVKVGNVDDSHISSTASETDPEMKETKEDSSTLKADVDAEDTPKELEEDIVTGDVKVGNVDDSHISSTASETNPEMNQDGDEMTSSETIDITPKTEDSPNEDELEN